MKKIENVRVSQGGEFTINAGFEIEGYRYHIWLDPEAWKNGEAAPRPDRNGLPVTLYKNPPEGQGIPTAPGYFTTRHLDGSKRDNAALIAALLSEVKSRGLVAVERARWQAEQDAREAQMQANLASKRKEAAAGAMYEAIKVVLAHVENENLPRVDNQCTLCFTHRKILRDALALADGGSHAA